MRIAGGVIALIAGIFGFIAAIVTLFFGGVSAAFDAKGADTVIGLGWGGVAFAFLVIVYGACAIGSKGRWSGYLLIVSSIGGAIFGGTLVAVCMVLSLIGGVLSLFGSRPTASIDTNAPVIKKSNLARNVAIGLLAVVAVFVWATMFGSKGGTNASGDANASILSLISAKPEDISPTGELADMFTLGSKNTDLQRDNEMSSLKGKVVQWTLPVYEVSKKDDGYKIQTSSGVSVLNPASGSIETFAQVTPQNDADRQLIEGLKTGDHVTIKGVISGEMMRHLELDPAIVVTKQSSNGSVATAATQQVPASTSSSDELDREANAVGAADVPDASDAPTATGTTGDAHTGTTQDSISCKSIPVSLWKAIQESASAARGVTGCSDVNLVKTGAIDTDGHLVVVAAWSSEGNCSAFPDQQGGTCGNNVAQFISAQLDDGEVVPPYRLDSGDATEIKIAAGALDVVMMTFGPNDAHCCPSVKTDNYFAFHRDGLIAVDSNGNPKP